MKTEAELHEALQAIHAKATGQTNRPYMRIPADPERDADLILSDAITELGSLRSLVEEAWGLIANCARGNWDNETEMWREAAVRWRNRYSTLIGALGCPTGSQGAKGPSGAP